jgi:hypothetical protein
MMYLRSGSQCPYPGRSEELADLSVCGEYSSLQSVMENCPARMARRSLELRQAGKQQAEKMSAVPEETRTVTLQKSA